jgi:hypothetical protein
MKRSGSLCGRRAVIVGMAATIAAAGTARGSEQPFPPRRFVYDDLIRYNAAVAAINGGAEPVTTLQRYLDGATDGMKTWLSIYPATAAELVSELADHPRYYASLHSMRERIAPFEPEIARAYAQMERIVPGAQLGTVYFLVGKRSAGGTARHQGTFVAVEFFGRTDKTGLSEFGEQARIYDLNELVQVVVHEGAHNLQRHIQGEPNFISIYVNPARMTLLNFAIREGVADYLTHQITDRRFEPRHAFAEPRERDIWLELRPIMHETILAQPGWFTGKFKDGRAWPVQVGYFVGFKMAEHVHRTGHRDAAGRRAALIELLSPHTAEQFAAIAARYAQKFA